MWQVFWCLIDLGMGYGGWILKGYLISNIHCSEHEALQINPEFVSWKLISLKIDFSGS